MADPLVPLSVVEVRLAVPAGPGVEAGMVVLAESAGLYRQLRIVIGRAEAAAINSAWRGEVPARPSTWDLFVSTVAVLDGRFTTATITAVEERRHWFAALDLERGDLRRAVSCRPSDAIAVALRSPGTALVAPEGVMALGGVLPDGSLPPPTPAAAAPGGGPDESISFT
ncbi:MAG TPA: bifunctional nuclease domain-containing protein [Acidimicrobiales bacterium]|nr:bifunctional nuclease domain-containing protein [Acidimicrobiales bacterium]